MEKEKKEVATRIDAPPARMEINIEGLIAQGIDKGLNVETMERLIAMARQLKADHAKEEFDVAMGSFQSQCPTIKKTKEVKTKSGIVAYRYAPIESIVEQVRELLSKNGFSFSTQIITGDAKVKAVCRVNHIAGHSEAFEMEVPLGNKTDIMSASQVVAAASTFAKRYAFCNAFGILTGDEDNDGATPAHDPAPKVEVKTDYSKSPKSCKPWSDYPDAELIKIWVKNHINSDFAGYTQTIAAILQSRGYTMIRGEGWMKGSGAPIKAATKADIQTTDGDAYAGAEDEYDGGTIPEGKEFPFVLDGSSK